MNARQIQYVFSNFIILSNHSTGGGPSAILEFRKLATQDNPSVVFFANAGEVASFIRSYNIAISPLAPGTASFVDVPVNRLDTGTATQNGTALVQMTLNAVGQASTCFAGRNLNGLFETSCSYPPATVNQLSAGDSLTIAGNSGNASIGQFATQFNAAFTVSSSSPIPEPSTFVLLGGLFALHRLLARA